MICASCGMKIHGLVVYYDYPPVGPGSDGKREAYHRCCAPKGSTPEEEPPKYFVAWNDPQDGDAKLRIYTRSELVIALNGELSGVDFSKEPIGMTLAGWASRGIIILGRAVIPVAKVTVTEWEI